MAVLTDSEIKQSMARRALMDMPDDVKRWFLVFIDYDIEQQYPLHNRMRGCPYNFWFDENGIPMWSHIEYKKVEIDE